MIKGWFKLDNHFTLTLHKWKMIKRTFIFKSFVWKDIYLKINYFISKTEYLSLFVMLFMITEKEFEWHIKVILLIKYIRETTVGVSIKYFVKNDNSALFSLDMKPFFVLKIIIIRSIFKRSIVLLELKRSDRKCLEHFLSVFI